MGTLDSPIVEAGDAEGAAVAHAAGDDFPSVGEVVAVFPDDSEHVAEVLRFGVTEAEGGEAGEALAEGRAGEGRRAQSDHADDSRE